MHEEEVVTVTVLSKIFPCGRGWRTEHGESMYLVFKDQHMRASMCRPLCKCEPF